MKKEKTTKWRIKALATTVLLIAILLILFEVILRLSGIYQSPLEANGVDHFSAYETFGRKLTWTRPPNTTINVNYQEFQYSFTTNSLGVRDIERDKENVEGKKRILLLGDSFMESFGAADDSTVMALMLAQINSQFPDNNVELMNGAVAGSDLFFNYLLLEHVLLDYHPSIVLFNVNSTDLMDYCVRGGLERMQPDGSFAFRSCPIIRELYRNCHLYRFWVHDVLGRELGSFLTKKNSAICQADFSTAANEVFTKLEQLSVAKNFQYRIIYQPMAYEVNNRQYNAHLAPYDGPNTIDLLPALKQHHDSIGPLYWPIDGHFTPYGYALYSQILVNRLAEQNLVP